MKPDITFRESCEAAAALSSGLQAQAMAAGCCVPQHWVLRLRKPGLVGSVVNSSCSDLPWVRRENLPAEETNMASSLLQVKDPSSAPVTAVRRPLALSIASKVT